MRFQRERERERELQEEIVGFGRRKNRNEEFLRE